MSMDCFLPALNSLPNDKILDQSKLKAFGDDKTNATKKLKFVLEMVENILGKGENAGKCWKILDQSKLKAFADDKINATKKLNIEFGNGRKHFRKRRKCWLLKVGIVC